MKTKRRKGVRCQRELETKLSEAKGTYAKNPSDINLEAVLAVINLEAVLAFKASLNYLLTHKAEQSIRLARQRLYEFGNKPNKYLARLVNKKLDSHCISAIKDGGGKRRIDLDNINKVFEAYYNQLYESNQPVPDQKFSDLFLSNMARPEFTDLQKETLNGPITEREVKAALHSLQAGKAPGPDRFGCEFYKDFY